MKKKNFSENFSPKENGFSLLVCLSKGKKLDRYEWNHFEKKCQKKCEKSIVFSDVKTTNFFLHGTPVYRFY